MNRVFLAAVAAMLPVHLVAQQASPACVAPEYRQFDFWVGDWSVTDSAGTVVYGTNAITREEGGCLVHEHWTSARGPTGQSFNFYTPATGQWTQVWVSSLGTVLHVTGRFDGRGMILEGERIMAAGTRMRSRIAWTPQPDGRVRQVSSSSQDGGASWQTDFDGWYRRRS